MAITARLTRTLIAGIPFIGIMLLWILVTGLVYGSFVLVWPYQPDSTPLMHLGVYLLPMIGYLGHTLQYAFGYRPDSFPAEYR